MQLRCGQCGSTFESEPGVPGGPVTCSECGHGLRLQDARPREVEAAAAAAEAEAGFAEIANKELRKRFHIVCGACSRHLTVGRRWAGRRGKCPACDGKIQIPHLEEHQDIDISYLTAETERLDLASAYETVTQGELVEVKDIEPVGVWRPRFLGTLMAVMVGVAATVWILILATGRSAGPAPERPPGEQRPGPRQQGEANGVATADNGGQRPETPPSKPVVEPPVKPPVEPPIAPPPEPQAVCEVLGAGWGVFAFGGYRPARPGYVYLKVTAKITSPEKDLRFASHGKDVSLRIGDRSVQSLGLARDSNLPLAPGVKTALSIPAGQSRELTFVFEVLAAGGDAKLSIRGLESTTAGRLEPPKRIDPGSMPGTYVERLPRNLKPLLRDPVMAAVQSAADQVLLIERRSPALGVRIPAAGVTGTAKPAASGLCEARLQRGEHELACKLRFVDEGRLVILYLSDEPFHQLTYERQ